MKNYLVIGGSSGIGLALTKMLAEDGHAVQATYYKSGVAAVLECVTYHPLNVLDPSLDFSFVPDQLHGLAYCPGSIQLKPFQRFTVADFEQDYRLQVLGAMQIIQAVLPKLKSAGGGSVVLFSTIAVRKGFPFHSMVAASKGALEGMSRALAAELAPTVRVNCIAPSITDTPLASKLLDTEDKRTNNAARHPLKKIGDADDIANIAAFLLSDKSSWITGQTIHVDGGLSTLQTA